MTSEYDELLARLDAAAARSTLTTLASEAAAAIRALTAHVVERDAMIESAPHGETCAHYWCVDPRPECDCWKSQAPHDALAARDAVRDKTVRATALRDAAGSVRPVVIRWEDHGGNIELMLEEWLHARADQEEL